jgi:hypothetical protein
VADLGTADPSARRRTRLLAAFLLVLVVVFGVVDLTGLLTSRLRPAWYGYLFFAAAGLLTRFGRYTAAAGVALAMFPVVILGMILDGSPSRPELSLVYLAPGVLLASILLSARGTALFAAFSLAAILATPFLVPEAVPSPRAIVVPLALVAITAGLALVSILHRDRGAGPQAERAMVKAAAPI